MLENGLQPLEGSCEKETMAEAGEVVMKVETEVEEVWCSV